MKYTFILAVFFLLHWSCSCLAQCDETGVFVFFDSGKAELKTEMKEKINNCISSLTKSVHVSIIGFADRQPFMAGNQQLSFKRAQAVAVFLQTNFPKKIVIDTIMGNGELMNEQLVTANSPSSRRVEVVFKNYSKTSKSKTKSVDFTQLEKMKVGESLEMNGLLFQPGRHLPLGESTEVLKQLLSTMKQFPSLKIEIQGHICCMPSQVKDGRDLDTGLDNLSAARAKMVFDYLVNNGIDASRLKAVGYGISKPKIWPERSELDATKNRRVEIMIIAK